MDITYQQIKNDAISLALLINNKYPDKYKAIFGIPAGGIAPAIYVEEILQTGNLLSLEEYNKYENKKEVLVIDDLIDSGETLKKYLESDIAVLYKKPHSPLIAKYVYKDIGSEWVSFPHEKDSTGILEHIIRIASFVDYRLSDNQQKMLVELLLSIKEK